MANQFFSGGPLIFAHRGASAHAPENTIAALQLAFEVGANGAEVDIRLTRDGVPIVFHDERLERLTNGIGPVAQLTFAEIASLDAGYRWSKDGGRTYPFRGRGLRIPSVEDVLREFTRERFILHLKSAAAARATRRALEALDASNRVIVAAHWSWILAPFRGSPIQRAMTTEGTARFLLRGFLRLPPRARRPFLVPVRRGPFRLNAEFVARAHAAGQPVLVWVVNRREEMVQLLEWGADAIETDRPDLGIEVLREWSAQHGTGPAPAAGA